MRKTDDQDYLKNIQYNRADRLNARITLHERYGREEVPWFRWVYQKLELGPGMRVLDVGCGPAKLWSENLDHLPASIEMTLVDLSEGMVGVAQANLAGDRRFSYKSGDVQTLPFPEELFDRVIANHMLYHVPDISRAIRELSRVLKSGGMLCASTNGKEHLRELYERVRSVAVELPEFSDPIPNFSLENAADILRGVFPRVEIFPKPSSLWVTEVEPLIAYVQSMWTVEGLHAEAIRALRQKAQTEIDSRGGIYISRMSGVALAWKAA